MTFKIFAAILVALIVTQLITVGPMDEALVRCAVLTIVLSILYGIVAALQALFRHFRRSAKTPAR